MHTIRIFFSKQGEAAYISHLDLQRVMARALRKSGLPVWYSQGFNPHIYMSFALPLPLMHESLVECVDCKTEAEDLNGQGYVAPLSAALPKGIEVTKIAKPVHDAGEIASAGYHIRYPEGFKLNTAVEGYNALPEAMVMRKTKRSQQQVDLKEVLPTLGTQTTQEGPVLEVRLPAGSNQHYSPALLTVFLQQFGLPQQQAHILRTQVFTRAGDVFQ